MLRDQHRARTNSWLGLLPLLPQIADRDIRRIHGVIECRWKCVSPGHQGAGERQRQRRWRCRRVGRERRWVSDGVRRCRGGGIVWYRVESSLCTAMTQSESVRDAHGRTERHLHSVVMRMQWEYPRVYRDHGVYKDERKKKKVRM